MTSRAGHARRAAALLCLAAAPPSVARGQQRDGAAPPTAAPGCPPPGALQPPNDTVRATLQLWLDGTAALPVPVLSFAEASMQEVAQRFAPLPSLSIPTVLTHVYDGAGSNGPPGPWLDARVHFALGQDGRVRGTRLVDPSHAFELNSALLAAVAAADSAGAIGPLPDHVGRDSIVFRLHLGQRPPTGVTAIPLLRVAVPYVRIDRPARQRRGKAPTYPPVARARDVEESMLVQFVVTEAGRADMATVRFLRGSYREFADAVLQALRSYEFDPALVSGCPVSQQVQLPFEFRLEN
jgi:TonB family protein